MNPSPTTTTPPPEAEADAAASGSDPDLSNDLRQLLGAAAPAGDQGHGSPGSLPSQRERQVLLALENGSTVAGVAERLMLSENTVKTHLRRIYEKLGVDNRRNVVLRARLSGELHPGPGRS